METGGLNRVRDLLSEAELQSAQSFPKATDYWGDSLYGAVLFRKSYLYVVMIKKIDGTSEAAAFCEKAKY